MQGLDLIESKTQTEELNEYAKALKFIVEDSFINRVELLGGVTYGSFAKGNAGPSSDLDVILFYKQSMDDGLMFKRDISRPTLSNKYKSEDSLHPLLYVYRAMDNGKLYAFDIDCMPVLRFKQKHGLLDSFAIHRVHDMMNLLYGKIIPGFDKPWIKEFKTGVCEEFHWDEEAVASHITGMCRSQLKKLKAEVSHKRINVIRALKLTTTALYIAYNGMMLIKMNRWYQGIEDTVKMAKSLLGEHHDFFVRAIETLRVRDEDMISSFTVTDFVKPAEVLMKLHDEIDEIALEKQTMDERIENFNFLNKYILQLYPVVSV